MTDRLNNDFAALLTPPPSHGVQFTQGKVLSWDNETLHNTIEWRGITLTDIPIVEGINALVIREGDIVGMMGWAPENAKGMGSWWILGKLSNPGEFVADLDVTAKLFRFVTETGAVLAFFGKEVDGTPVWMLNYGGEDEQPALRIANGQHMLAYYRDGGIAWRIQGDVGSQFFAIYDETGHETFATDGASKTGVSRPYLNIPMVPSSGTSVVVGGPFWPAFTNVNYQEVFHCFSSIWHPRISIGVQQSVTAGTVDWELRFNGVTAGSGSGAGSATFNVPGWGTAITPGEVQSVQLFARNTSGTQSRVNVDRCYGLQS
jgi:hypothetical protein